MTDKNGNNVCYCDYCSHETARECIELRCPCCLKADQIRLNHIVVPPTDLSYSENERREKEEQSKKEERELYPKWYAPWQP